MKFKQHKEKKGKRGPEKGRGREGKEERKREEGREGEREVKKEGREREMEKPQPMNYSQWPRSSLRHVGFLQLWSMGFLLQWLLL